MYARVVHIHCNTQPICYDFTKQDQNCGLFHTLVKKGCHPIYAKVVRMHSETQPICYDFAKQHQNCGLFHTSVKEGSHPMYANPGSCQDIYCSPDSQIVFCSNPRSREYPSNPVVCEVVLSLPYMPAFNCSCYLYLHIYVYRVFHKGIIH